jgi:rhodanese-related sulfurtransferase
LPDLNNEEIARYSRHLIMPEVGMAGQRKLKAASVLLIGAGGLASPLGLYLTVAGVGMCFRELKLRRDPSCPLWGEEPVIRELIDYDQFCGVTPREEETTEAADWEITATDLKAKLDRGEPLTIIDVRDPHEWQICNLETYGSKLIPLGQFAARMYELNSEDDIVVHCKMGGRSADAYRMLQQAGFKRIKNLWGGITAWADQVDSNVPKY